MVSVKICGVRDPETARFALDAGANWVGVVLVESSPRHVDLAQASSILDTAGKDRTVALVVDPTLEAVAALKSEGFGIIQLHGSETPERADEIRSAFSGEVWKAVGVSSRADLAAAEAFAADRLLVDAKPPKDARRTGGHGVAFDWKLLEGWASPKPWLLAGGVTPENVKSAVEETGAQAVDVSSGVESETGIKDRALIERFIEAAKGN